MSQKEVLIGESGRKQKAFKLPHVKCAEKKSCKGDEPPQIVRTAQKEPPVGNIEFLGGEASCQRRLSCL